MPASTLQPSSPVLQAHPPPAHGGHAGGVAGTPGLHLAPAPATLADPACGNRVLGALPPATLLAWRALLQPLSLTLDQVLSESGQAMTHAYFPVTAIVSLMYVTEDGASTEVAVVGNEGLVGTPLFLGGGSTPSRVVVRNAGQALRLPAAAIRAAFESDPAVTAVLLRYTQALITQMAQTAVCNRHHTIDQRLCRWLLLSLDRLQGNELTVTQGLIADALGVRREGITEATMTLQRAGLIRTSRGHVEVLDRHGLEQRSCECYAVVQREYDRLMPA
jgi:CRP-like cAMP-binding protein